MKLLYDNNLSPKLVKLLADVFPGSAHVFGLGMEEAGDVKIWDYARDQGYTIIAKDSDFDELSTVRGFPPKVIWVRLGNCTTAQVHALLRESRQEIIEFAGAREAGVLSLG